MRVRRRPDRLYVGISQPRLAVPLAAGSFAVPLPVVQVADRRIPSEITEYMIAMITVAVTDLAPLGARPDERHQHDRADAECDFPARVHKRYVFTALAGLMP